MTREEGKLLDAGRAARLAAEDNLTLAYRVLEDEVLAALGRIHGEVRQRIERLLENLHGICMSTRT